MSYARLLKRYKIKWTHWVWIYGGLSTTHGAILFIVMSINDYIQYMKCTLCYLCLAKNKQNCKWMNITGHLNEHSPEVFCLEVQQDLSTVCYCRIGWMCLGYIYTHSLWSLLWPEVKVKEWTEDPASQDSFSWDWHRFCTA